MTKLIKVLATSALLITALNAKDTKIIVGATPVPHSEILEFIKDDVKSKGYTLQIKEFTDYVTPNLALEDGDLDANFFQHTPYLDEFNKNKGTHLVKTTGVHIEPLGVYSDKIKNLNELKKGDSVAIPNDPTNESRALDLLAKAKLIKLNDNKLKTPLDITENKLNLKFNEIEAPQLPRVLPDVKIAVINTNYALDAKLNPTKDALIIEGSESPYVNIVVVKKGNENSEKTKILHEVLTTQKVKNFILKKYDGAIVPVF